MALNSMHCLIVFHKTRILWSLRIKRSPRLTVHTRYCLKGYVV